MSNDNQNQKPFNLLAFLRRSQEWLEVSGYHVGDIQSENKPVLITAGTTVVGDIFAPQVSISGLVCGSVAARKIVIEQTGQVWGDLFTLKLDLKAGGKVQGWASSVNEETIASLLVERRLPIEIATPEPVNMPEDEHGTPLPNTHDDLELITYHQLQTEVAAARAARAELEHSFDKRLSEVAGDASGKIASLSNQLEQTSIELTAVQDNISAAEKTIRNRDAQIERQQNELELSRDLINEQSTELEQLRQTKSNLSRQFQQLQEEKEQLDQTLQRKLQLLENQADRIHSIETAMQSSLQHSSDLEESLVRWQELAEVTENRVEELEKELANKQFQLEESSKLVEMIQQQKQQIEGEWQKLHSELESTRNMPTQPLQEGKVSAINEEILVKATAQVTQLEAELENLAQERAAQILWYRTNLEISMAELESVRQQALSKETALASLQTYLIAQEKETEKWQTAVSTLQSKFEKRHQKWQQWQQQVKEEMATLKDGLQQKEHQLAASEDDLRFHLQEIEKQGERLAQTQATLTERELQLKQARKVIEKQNQAIKNMRTQTEAYIRKLQSRIRSTASID